MTVQTPAVSLIEYFADLPDPRINRTRRHLLSDIVTIAVCAVLCGADNWVDIEFLGNCKKKWFQTFLALPHGIPSHDTFGRVFAALDPQAFHTCFTRWIRAVAEAAPGVVAIDGKTLRRSFDHAAGKAAIHMVSAWADENELVLGQVKTDEKSNEITAIPELLKLLLLKGAIVTLDAMGCQKKIAEAIVLKEADYVLALKGNQGTLEDEVKLFFEGALACQWKDTPHDYHETREKNHGRIEVRRYFVTPEIEWFSDRSDWKNLRSFGMVESQRDVGGTITTDRRLYISSLPGNDAKMFARAVRRHWGIENKLHWTLDMAFREDESRAREGYAAENLATIRHIALNLLKQEKTGKGGISCRRKGCGWSEDYLLKVLTMGI